MGHIIFLRGSVPPADEHPDKLVYSDVEEDCEDQWTQLFYFTLKRMGPDWTGELVYQGAKKRRKVVYESGCFKEVHTSSIAKFPPEKEPTIIIARGGFPYYDSFVKRWPDAVKVYYGAGKRFYPMKKGQYSQYDLFLVDSKKQLDEVAARGKNVDLLLKPAATMFKPMAVGKTYDVCFMANATQAAIKRHALLLEAFAGTDYKIMNIGNVDKQYVKMASKLDVNITWVGWKYRRDLPKLISQCKVGVVCSTNYDSCPRVIPEYLACGLPVVATNNINFDHAKYINKTTGVLVKEKNILSGVEKLLKSDKSHDVVRYYRKELDMHNASTKLSEQLKELLQQ